MDLPTQPALLDRTDAHRAAGTGADLAPAAMYDPAATHVAPDRLGGVG